MSVQSLAPRLPTVLATALAAALLALLGTGIACIRADRTERSGRTASASSSPSASPSSSPAPGPTVAPEGSTVADDLGADSHPESRVESGARPLTGQSGRLAGAHLSLPSRTTDREWIANVERADLPPVGMP